jgi:hypothetical protein
LNHTLNGDLCVPVIKQTWRFPLQLGYTYPMSVRIHPRVPTKDRASIAPLHRFPQTIIEARQHNVILVKNMNPMTSGALNAPIPSIRQT